MDPQTEVAPAAPGDVLSPPPLSTPPSQVVPQEPLSAIGGEGESEQPLPGPAPALTFWQQPWVQNVLPFVTSLSVHLALLAIGFAAFGVYKVVTAPPHEEQVVIPEAEMAAEGPPGGVPNVGAGGDPLRQAMQDKDPSAAAAEGAFDKKGPTVDLTSASASGDASADATIALGPGGGFSKGSGAPGASAGGDTGGAMAMFGTPGGGGIGPKGPVFGDGGNARTIAFLCDSTGSMFSKMPQLKYDLDKEVSKLKPIQSFSLVFFHEPNYQAFDGGVLLPASPDNKRKASKWLADVIASGQTNPLPAMEAAFKQKPQLVYFLTDAADFPDNKAVLELVRKYNRDKRMKINTILFVENSAEREKNRESEKLMTQISSESGGKFRWVEMDKLQ